MEISFASKKLYESVFPVKNCNSRYGHARARCIHKRLNQLDAAPTLAAMRGIGDCHELKGVRAGTFAIDLDGPYRLTFRPTGPPESYMHEKNIFWDKVTAIEVLSIEDYH